MSDIAIDHWIHAISVMADVHGWFVQEYKARSKSPTHILLKDGVVVVVFARPSGGKLMAQHTEPWREWTKVAQANEKVTVHIVTPASCAVLWAYLQDGGVLSPTRH